MAGTKSPRYSEEFKKTIVNLHQNGKSYAEIEQEYGVSHSALTLCGRYIFHADLVETVLVPHKRQCSAVVPFHHQMTTIVDALNSSLCARRNGVRIIVHTVKLHPHALRIELTKHLNLCFARKFVHSYHLT